MTTGNGDIVEALIQHKAALLQFLTRQVGCVHTSADLFQRLAEKLLRQKQPPITSSMRAYLYRAASSEAASYFRGERRRASYEMDCARLQDELDACYAERRLAGEEALRVLDAALQSLPPLTRRIFFLCRVQDVSQREVAESLGLSVSTVEKKLAVALKHCRESVARAENNRRSHCSSFTGSLLERR
jgi:RNA polymerase sigma-70 factor (ECF subfamily)